MRQLHFFLIFELYLNILTDNIDSLCLIIPRKRSQTSVFRLFIGFDCFPQKSPIVVLEVKMISIVFLQRSLTVNEQIIRQKISNLKNETRNLLPVNKQYL